MDKRISRLLDGAAGSGADLVLITSLPNAEYLSGFTGSNVTLLVSTGRRILLTDQRYGNQAELESPGWEIVVHGPDREGALADLVNSFADATIAYEDNNLTASRFSGLLKLKPADRWIPLGNELLRLRAIKDESEIALIRQSAAIAQAGFAAASESMLPGVTEVAVAAEIEYRMALAGSEGPAFPTIVAAGENSAYPHAHPGSNRFDKIDLVTIDWGAVHRGYHSDLTRVVQLGKIDSERERLLSLTLSAFDRAMEVVAPGVTGDQVDAAARAVFAENGTEEWSLRGLGHGVGLEIHENPRIVMGSQEVLEPGMVFTIEPGLYVPGIGGARVEHTVLLTESGPEVLTTELPLVIGGDRI